jgi:hypothetical protein
MKNGSDYSRKQGRGETFFRKDGDQAEGMGKVDHSAVFELGLQ